MGMPKPLTFIESWLQLSLSLWELIVELVKILRVKRWVDAAERRWTETWVACIDCRAEFLGDERQAKQDYFGRPGTDEKGTP